MENDEKRDDELPEEPGVGPDSPAAGALLPDDELPEHDTEVERPTPQPQHFGRRTAF